MARRGSRWPETVHATVSVIRAGPTLPVCVWSDRLALLPATTLSGCQRLPPGQAAKIPDMAGVLGHSTGRVRVECDAALLALCAMLAHYAVYLTTPLWIMALQ